MKARGVTAARADGVTLKRIAILGSTGSIGTQACEVVERLGEGFGVEALSAHANGELLLEQSRRLAPSRACMTDPEAASRFAGRFKEAGIAFYAGAEGLVEMIEQGEHDLVLNSVVGSAGLIPTIKALESGIPLALANKESLVAGGDLVMRAARESGTEIIPVDSEHSAIFQCLRGEEPTDIRRILLTASGGPFRRMPADQLESVGVDDAMAHPTWSMGMKVTVDSATLMNKGLEVLEAHHLFSVDIDDIEVVVHPQSVIHSMVEMTDGSVLAQMGVPDMRTPIQYAITYPERRDAPAPLLDLVDYGSLSFEPVDDERFPCLGLAYRAGRAGRTYPAAMNAANEEAVRAFVAGRIGFQQIAKVVGSVLESHESLPGDSLEEIIEAGVAARALATDEIARMEAPG